MDFAFGGGSCPLPAEAGCRPRAVGNGLGGSIAAGAAGSCWEWRAKLWIFMEFWDLNGILWFFEIGAQWDSNGILVYFSGI